MAIELTSIWRSRSMMSTLMSLWAMLIRMTQTARAIAVMNLTTVKVIRLRRRMNLRLR